MSASAGSGGGRRATLPLLIVVFGLLLVGVLVFLKSSGGESPAASQEVAAPVATPRPTTAPDREAAAPQATATPDPGVAVEAPVIETALVAAETPADKRTPKATITGRVTSLASGRPIAGARVSIISTSLSMDITRPPVAEVETETDEQGRYRLYSFEKSGPSMFGQGDSRIVRVEAEDFGSLGAIVQTGGVREVTQDFALPFGTTISGRVVRASGGGVPDALVGSVILGEMTFMTLAQQKAILFPSCFTVAEEGGAFTLRGVPEGESLRLPARAAGLLPAMGGPFAAGASGVEIVLGESNARMFGKVTTSDGEPVQGAIIMAFNMMAMMGGTVGDLAANQHLARSDADGAYNLGPLPAGGLMVIAMQDFDAGLGRSGVLQEMVTLTENQELEKNFQFAAPIVIVGKAIDSTTGKGLAGVRLSSQPYELNTMIGGLELPDDESERIESISDAEGAFRLEVASLGMVTIFFYKAPDSYIIADDSATRMGMAPGTYMLEGQGATDKEIELRFRQGVVVSGIVTEPDGTTPASGVTVAITKADTYHPTTTKTDETGAYRLAADPGSTGALRARGDSGSAEQEITIPAAGKELTNINLTLRAFATVTGRVTAPGDKPVANITVRANPVSGSPRYPFMGVGPSGFGSAMTDGQGVYVITDAPASEVEITAVPQDGSDFSAPKALRLTLEPGETRANVDLRLLAGDYIEGVVTDEDGKPLSGVSIIAQAYSATPAIMKQARTDKDGYYRVAGIPQDQTLDMLMAMHPGYENVNRQSVSIYDNPQNITLKRLRGVVVEAIGRESKQPVTSYEYRLLQEQWRGYTLSAMHTPARVQDSAGRVELSTLEKGKWRVEVVALDEKGAPTASRGMAEFSVAEGSAEAQIVRVTVDEGRTVKGRVRLVDTEEPVRGVHVGVAKPVSFMGTGSVTHATFDIPGATSDSAGRFELKGVPVGMHKLTIVAEGRYPARDYTLTIQAESEPEELIIDLATGGTVYGKVIGWEGQPMAGLTMTRSRRNEGGWQIVDTVTFQTDEQGAFRQEGLQPSQWSVGFDDAESGLKDTRWINVEAGKEEEVIFDYSEMVILSGKVRVNGQPWGMNIHLQTNMRGEAAGSNWASFDRKGTDGGYELRVKPGTHDIRYNRNDGVFGFFNSPIEVLAEPRRQTRDIALEVADVDAIVVTEGTAPFIKGRLTIHQKHRDNDQQVLNWEIESARRRISGMPAGSYRASYQAGDGSVNGESEWTDIGPGKENALVIFPQKSQRRLLGRWNAESITTDEKVHSFDATAALRDLGGGDIRIEVVHDSGQHGVNISWVALLEDGREIQRDTHEGWSGYSKRDNIYRVPLAQPRQGARYTVDVSMRSDGGTNSEGMVWIVVKSPE
ncbi:MAG: carboxypeptidase regulatory-like domain-containing protein [Candidatus Sumerlaeia bacterium]|nr:carboxypeptidase regulatory-like domain-containing protein [Candidatus Sumerlaeia bacterium]